MSPGPGIMDTWAAKILYAVLGKVANAVGTGFSLWSEDFSKELHKIDTGDVRKLMQTGNPAEGITGGILPSQMGALSTAAQSFWTSVAQSALGHLGVAKGVFTLASVGPLQEIVQKLDYLTRSTWPIWMPDPGTLSAASVKMGAQLEYISAFRLHGLDDWATQAYEDAARHRLSPAEYWTAYRRGDLGEEDFRGRMLSLAGLFKDDRGLIEKINARLPDLPDLFAGWRRGVLKDADFNERLFAGGYRKEDSDFWRKVLSRLPTLADVWTAYRRGKLSAGDFDKALFTLGYREGDKDFYDEVLRTDIPLEYLVRLFHYGHIEAGTFRTRLQELGFRSEDVADLLAATYTYPDPAAWLAMNRRGIVTDAEYRDALQHVGYGPATLTKIEGLKYEAPDPATVTTWRRRGLIDDAGFDRLLKMGGLSDEHTGYMRELVNLIPGPADLISMAVREAFTPSAIEKFQLHEDFPPEFAEWGAKVGLTEEWAKRYWAAHWTLPGVREVFEIFHRIDRTTGEPYIDEATVDEYLKVADISPYWRPKLRAISYSPYTRVDVRRMFQMGFVDRDELKRTYRDLGYDEDHAENLTAWTEQEYKPAETDLTRADILDAYRKGLIDRNLAVVWLKDIGIRDMDAVFYLNRTDYQIETDKKELTLATVKTLFVEDLIGVSEVRERLAAANYMEGEVVRLLALWRIEKEKTTAGKAAKTTKPTRTDLDRFLKAGVITMEEYEDEMRGIGYADKYIWMYEAAAYMAVVEET